MSLHRPPRAVAVALAFATGSGACKPDVPPPVTTRSVQTATLAASVRDPADAPVPGAETSVGYENTPPDPAGMIRYPKQLAGRLGIRSEADGWTMAATAAILTEDNTSGARLVMAPLDVTTGDPTGTLTLADAEVELDFPPGTITTPGGTAVTGDIDLGWYRVGEQDPAGPGQRIWLEDDQYERPLDAFLMFYLAAPKVDGVELAIAPDVGTLHWSVGAEWPHADAEKLALYQWNGTLGYWTQGKAVTVEDGAIDTTLTHWGWYAVAATPPPTACVTGVVLDSSGAPVVGAEVTILEQGRVSVDRAFTGSDGYFCAATLPQGTLELSVWGWDAPGKVLVTGQTATDGGDVGDCPGPCRDLGPLPVTYHRDSDGDYFWESQGDCDDSDLTVNPIDSGDLCIGD